MAKRAEPASSFHRLGHRDHLLAGPGVAARLHAGSLHFIGPEGIEVPADVGACSRWAFPRGTRVSINHGAGVATPKCSFLLPAARLAGRPSRAAPRQCSVWRFSRSRQLASNAYWQPQQQRRRRDGKMIDAQSIVVAAWPPGNKEQGSILRMSSAQHRACRPGRCRRVPHGLCISLMTPVVAK